MCIRDRYIAAWCLVATGVESLLLWIPNATNGMCGLVTWQFRQRFTRHKSGLKVSCATDLSEGSDTNSRGVTGGGPGGGGGETFPHTIASCKSSKLSSRAYQASGAEHT